MPRPPIKAKAADGDPWKTIASGVSDILSCRQSSLSLSSLHSAVGTLVSQSKLDDLANGLLKILDDHFKGWSQELSQVVGGTLIGTFSKIYEDFQNYCRIIPKFYMLYDRRFDTKNGRSEIGWRMRKLFVDKVLSDRLIRDTTTGLRKDIAIARSHGEVDLGRVKKLLEMYYSFRDDEPKLPIFDEFFEAFIEETCRFYDEFYKVKSEGNSFLAYLQIASEQFTHEENMMRDVLKDKEVQRVLDILHSCLLLTKEDVFTAGDEPPISVALTAGDMRPVKWLVDMYSRFESDLRPVCSCCAIYVQTQMLKLTGNFKPDMKASDVTRFVGELIDLTVNLSRPYELAFSEVPRAMELLEGAIKTAWNNEKFDIVNNFCAYIDQQIKGEFKSFSPEDRQRFPAVVAQFYSRLDDRKTFASMYEAMMIRRFIKMQDKLPDLERPIINAVRRVKAPDFASRFNTYDKKIKESHELESKFKEEQQRSGTKTKIGFSPLVFDHRDFPLGKNEAHNIPQECFTVHKLFVSSYQQQHPNTKLMLLSDVSVVESKLVVPKNAKSRIDRPYTVSCDLLCASIIDAIATGPKTMREICDVVSDRALVGKYLVRLCHNSCPILKRIAKSNKLTDDDVFELNAGFFSQGSRVVVPPIFSEKKADKKHVKQHVDMDKASSIKAACVRFLKMRVRVDQTTLENDVTDYLMQYFRADPAVIRSQLVSLENEDYLERTTDGGRAVLIYKQ